MEGLIHLRSRLPRQSEDPAVRWQLNLYRDRALRFEGPPDPEKVLDRIQRISAAVFNLEQVGLGSSVLRAWLVCAGRR